MCETQTDRSQTMLSLNAFCSVNRNIIWQLLSKNGHFLKKDFVGKYKEVCIGKYERGTCLTCPMQDLLLFYFFLSFSSLEELTNLPMRYVALSLLSMKRYDMVPPQPTQQQNKSPTKPLISMTIMHNNNLKCVVPIVAWIHVLMTYYHLIQFNRYWIPSLLIEAETPFQQRTLRPI